jgi:hypothetical protein
MRAWRLLSAAVLASGLAPVAPAGAVDLALVLLTDVSRSMDEADYALVKAGYRSAFADPEMVAALAGNPGGVAVAYVEFSGRGEVTLVKGWDLLSDAASAAAFGAAIAAAPRTAAGDTAIGPALASAARFLQDSGFEAARRVIDIASDETGDGGRTVRARDRIVADGITINAIPLLDTNALLAGDGARGYNTVRWGSGSITEFYERDVIGGAGAFVLEAADHAAFGAALKRKLLLELIAAR